MAFPVAPGRGMRAPRQSLDIVPSPAEEDNAPAVRALYLDLLKKALTFWLWGEAYREVRGHGSARRFVIQPLLSLLGSRRLALVRRIAFDPAARAEGRDVPESAHTMVGLRRLDNVQACIEQLLAEGVSGDLIETGVWRGGTVIFMRGVLKAYGSGDRTVWAADSFSGHPPPDLEKYPVDRTMELHKFDFQAVSLEEVRANFDKYGLLDGQVRFLKGWFKDTLPAAPVERVALMRLDGVSYGATMEALTYMYPKLSVGGFVIIDDYECAPEAHQAVDDFRRDHGIDDPLVPVDWTCVYWRRSG
jgi:O-methyltransferase